MELEELKLEWEKFSSRIGKETIIKTPIMYKNTHRHARKSEIKNEIVGFLYVLILIVLVFRDICDIGSLFFTIYMVLSALFLIVFIDYKYILPSLLNSKIYTLNIEKYHSFTKKIKNKRIYIYKFVIISILLLTYLLLISAILFCQYYMNNAYLIQLFILLISSIMTFHFQNIIYRKNLKNNQ